MFRPVLEPYHPLVKLVFFFLLSFSTLGVFYFIGVGIARAGYGIDLISDPLILQEIHRPEVRKASRWLILCQHIGMFIVPALTFPLLASSRGSDLLMTKRKPSGRMIAGTLLLMFFLFPVINWLVEWNAGLSLPDSLAGVEEWMKRMEEQAQRTTEAILDTTSLSGLAVNLLVVGILPALGEELVFRGVVQKLLARWSGSVHAGIWGAGLLFSSMHLQFYGFLPRLLLGVLFGYLLIMSGSLWIPVLAHFINNATAVVVNYLVKTGMISSDVESHGAQGAPFSIVLGTLFLLLLLYGFYRNSCWPAIREDYLKDPGLMHRGRV